MKKYFFVPTSLFNIVLCAALGAMVASPAQAQSQSQSQQDERKTSASAANTSDLMDSRSSQSPSALPSIRSGRADGRAPARAVTTRPSRPDKPAKGAFESYVETVTGRSLPIFGSDLFSDVPSTFAPSDGAQVNPDYVVGTGDELQIRGWGMIDIDVSASVDRSGAVYIPRVGAVRVAGVKYRDLQDYLKKSVSRFFNNFELSVSIAQTRAVQVYVVGHAVRPGTYTLNSMSTLVNALFTSGGPDATGSMRNIQLKRGSTTVTTFDLYDMLVNGDKSKDVALHDGDVIFIPEVGPMVALSGNVKQPAIFELRGPTVLADVVRWAGGFDSATGTKRVVVEKSVENAYRTVVELGAEQEAAAAQLGAVNVGPSDILRVFAPGAVPVQIVVKNEYVRVSGEVQKSGVFQIQKGETLRDLLIRLGGTTENGYVFATQLTRDLVRQAQQKKMNEIADRFDRDLDAAASARLQGSADKDNAAFVAADLERQHAVARRLREIKAEGRISLELEDENAEVKNLPAIALQDGDAIYIPRRPGTIEVMGAVFQPSSFAYRPQRAVNDYLDLAGGPTAGGDKSEMYVIRADGTAKSARSMGWFRGLGGYRTNPGDTIVIPEKVERRSWTQNFKEWTAIFYQFGLGAAGLKVLQN
jgi:polysaccharide export outer membrane protein